MSPRVLLIDPAARDRLQVMALLQGHADVHAPEEGEDPLRRTRRTRFDAVLVALPRLAARRGLHLCRTIRTDGGNPPPVGILDPWRRLGDIPGALTESDASGYLGGEASADDLADFLTALLANDRPCVVRRPPMRSVWARLRGGF